ncbi:hypothetical protein Dimus_008102 [Dionaea muscipula]
MLNEMLAEAVVVVPAGNDSGGGVGRSCDGGSTTEQQIPPRGHVKFTVEGLRKIMDLKDYIRNMSVIAHVNHEEGFLCLLRTRRTTLAIGDGANDVGML